MGDVEDVYKGLGGWIALHYWLWRSRQHSRKQKICYRVARLLPRTVKLYVLANAAAEVCNGGLIEPHKVTYADMCDVIEGKHYDASIT